jgi:DNA repair protein RecO (recombination protein O)
MANYVTDDAVCLRVTDFSETSQIVGLFTRGHGLVPMIAKGAKRQTKKNTMSGPLDLLTSGEVVYVPPPQSKGAAELSILAGWELGNHRTELRRDLAGLNAAMVCAEVTTMLLHPHDPHEELYQELEAALELLGSPQGSQRMRAVVAYVKAALEAAGYAPQLEACLVCGRALAADVPMRFFPHAGGVACGARGDGPGCQMQGLSGTAIAVGGRIVIALQRLPLPRALLANPPERAADAGALSMAMQMLLAQVESITDKRVRTRYLLPGIFGMPAKE